MLLSIKYLWFVGLELASSEGVITTLIRAGVASLAVYIPLHRLSPGQIIITIIYTTRG